MGATIRGKSDKALEQLARALAAYSANHPKADIMLFRRNPACISIRIVDPDFAKMKRDDRDELISSFFESIDEDIQSQIYTLSLLTPKETKTSIANMDFENSLRTRRKATSVE